MTGNFINFDDQLDPSVTASIGGAAQRKSEAQLPQKDRQKKVKERKKAQKRKPRRVNWDLPPELKRITAHLAEDNNVPVSQVVAVLLLEALRRFEAGEIDLDDYKTPTTSPRYDWNLEIDAETLENLEKAFKGHPIAKYRDGP
jgi:hypothetical protein